MKEYNFNSINYRNLINTQSNHLITITHKQHQVDKELKFLTLWYPKDNFGDVLKLIKFLITNLYVYKANIRSSKTLSPIINDVKLYYDSGKEQELKDVLKYSIEKEIITQYE